MGTYVKWAVLILTVGLAAGAVGYARRPGPALVAEWPGQDIMSVDRRVSTLEQRIYTIDSNISQLQQQLMMMSRTSAPSAGAGAEVQQLRLELDLLKGRINQIECAVAKLDERTLGPAKPKGRSGVKDPCRQDPQTPIELQGHPY
jgi:hypothetical protein